VEIWVLNKLTEISTSKLDQSMVEFGKDTVAMTGTVGDPSVDQHKKRHGSNY
jgi:hypothetical protein